MAHRQSAADLDAAPVPDKACVVCGRRFQWRAAWARDWTAVATCSAACRRAGVGAADRALEQRILDLLAGRAASATICPSDVARAVAPDDWRPLMEPVRRAARRLVAAGEVDITQGGRRGPVYGEGPDPHPPPPLSCEEFRRSRVLQADPAVVGLIP